MLLTVTDGGAGYGDIQHLQCLSSSWKTIDKENKATNSSRINVISVNKLRDKVRFDGNHPCIWTQK